MKDNLIPLQKQAEKISFGLGGGAAYGIITYHLVKHLLDAGINPNEYSGNSAGAIICMLFSQGYTDQKNIDFFFSGVNSTSDITLPYLYGRLIPFCVNLSEANRKFIVENIEDFVKYIRNKKISHQMSSIKLKGLLGSFFQGYNKELSEEEGIKLTFNDIEKAHKRKLIIQASIITIKRNLWKNTQNTQQNDRGNKSHNKFTRSINFRGSFPVIDALIASVSPGVLRKTQIKGKGFTTSDGFLAGQQYPHKNSDFSESNNTKVVFMTDDNSILNNIFNPSFQETIDYVVCPHIEGNAFDFSLMARKKYEKLALDLISTT